VLNEVTEALLLYHILCFSDLYTQNEGFKDKLAYSFNCVIFLNISIHITLLLHISFVNGRNKYRRGQCCCQKTKNRNPKKEKPNRVGDANEHDSSNSVVDLDIESE
jgi:hypothetical protein